MTVKSGQVWSGLVVTKGATGALATPTVGPAGVLYVDGTANAASVTISGSNPYKWTVTLPSLTAGQCVSMYITATIATIATASVVAEDVADTVRLSDVPAVNVTYWAGGALPTIPSAADNAAAVGAQNANDNDWQYVLTSLDKMIVGGPGATRYWSEFALNEVIGADGDTLEALSDQLDAVSTLDAAGVRTAIGMADADMDDQLDAILVSAAACGSIIANNTDATAAGSITRKRGNSWSIALTLGAITGWTSLWFTVKNDEEDADTAALLHIKLNATGLADGLLYVNGAAATDDALASITVSDEDTGAIIVAVDETITAQLAPGTYVYDAQALISGDVTTPDSGTFTVTADVTRSVV